MQKYNTSNNIATVVVDIEKKINFLFIRKRREKKIILLFSFH
jgi:hypothetical protein